MKRILNLVIPIFLSLIITINLQAQKVTNVWAEQNGQKVLIYYDLSERAKISIDINKPVQMKKVTGDIGMVHAGKNKKIEWSPLEETGLEKFEYDNVSFKVNAKPVMKTFILGTFGYSPTPQYSGGIMAGMVSQCGWYAQFRSNFIFGKATDGLSCTEGGYIGDERPFYNGVAKKSHIVADVGFVCKMGCPLYFYIGGGFGMRQIYWQTIDNKWVLYKPTS
ncbi:MAG: hypothetical protein MJ007_06685, partial [Paludibacteraceae bacterium]|nr:hypothetical protein [Paludibacteraceae bacterium]